MYEAEKEILIQAIEKFTESKGFFADNYLCYSGRPSCEILKDIKTSHRIRFTQRPTYYNVACTLILHDAIKYYKEIITEDTPYYKEFMAFYKKFSFGEIFPTIL